MIAGVMAMVCGVIVISLAGVRAAQSTDQLPFQIPLGLMRPYIPYENPLTLQKVRLGELLFFDKRLSSDGKVSCGTCHNPALAFTDNRQFSIAVNGRLTKRNVPTILNVALFELMNWDGKALTLELQARGALLNPEEMGMSEEGIAAILSSHPEYRELFAEVFGKISLDKAVMAIAAYERTLLSGDSPFDKFMYAGDENAISTSAKQGFEIFLNKGQCIVCHQIRHGSLHPFGGSTALFTDDRFHNLGVGMDKPSPDLGRFEVTKNWNDVGKFKTPTLRNVALTAPYMHNGSLATLEEVINFYDRGGIQNSNLDSGIRPLNLDRYEKADLLEFLKSLTSSKLKFNSTKLGITPYNRRDGR